MKTSLWKRVWFVVKWLEIRLRFVLILVVTALVVGYWDTLQNYYERWQRHRHGDETAAGAATAASAFEFFCPMHQFVVRATLGKCPICGMDLSRRQKGAPVTLPPGVLARVQASPERILQAGVKVETLGYHLLARTVRSYGVVEPDETRLARITARFPGRVEELLVNTTGQLVKKGETLARIYSPKYLAAAQEFLQALNSSRQTAADAQATAEDKQRAARIAEFARQRLFLAGYSNTQLDEIAATGKAATDVLLAAPLGGTVLEKNVLAGQAVEEGTTLYTIADLTTLWVQVQVVESDIEAVKVGMPVEITSIAYAGRIFYGTVDFLAPTLNTENRALKVRVVVGNPDASLRPGMAVNAVIRAPLGKWGVVGANANANSLKGSTPNTPPGAEPAPGPGLANANAAPPAAEPAAGALPSGASPRTPKEVKDIYWCPMHPEVTSDKADATCEKCGGMKLIKKAQAAATTAPAVAEVYTCPMHPEVISDKPGDCPKCGMHLVKKDAAATPPVADSAAGDDAARWVEGYACSMHPEELSDKPGVCITCGCGMKLELMRIERVLAVPEAAVVDTGRRKIVYVEAEPGVFDAREVDLGARSGTWYPVLKGLKAGDRVAGRGAFLIDAEARLNPAAAGAATP